MEEVIAPESDSPTSLWMIRAAELFPKDTTEKEEANMEIPFVERKHYNIIGTYNFILIKAAKKKNNYLNVFLLLWYLPVHGLFHYQ